MCKTLTIQQGLSTRHLPAQMPDAPTPVRRMWHTNINTRSTTHLNDLSMHKPHNDWHTTKVSGKPSAVTWQYVSCTGEVCRGFEVHMLAYWGRFTIKPFKTWRALYTTFTCHRVHPAEFVVLCLASGSTLHSINPLCNMRSSI